jgi:drug/metabolite transporter (DMT)-like permease
MDPRAYETRTQTWLPYLLLALTVLFWSGNIVVGRAAREVLPPIAFNFWRWVIALAIRLPFAWREMVVSRPVILREWKILILLAITGITTFHSAVYTGLSQTAAINGALYFATSLLFFVLLMWALFASVIAYIFWNRGVREVGPNPAGLMLNLMPVFSAVLAIALLGERLAGYHWLGAALAGILVAGRTTAPPTRTEGS